MQGEFVVADLRNEHDEVGTLDYGDAGPAPWSVGRRSRCWPTCAMSGLSETAGRRRSAGEGVAMPELRRVLEMKLASTQSVGVPQCKAVVDVSQGSAPI